MTDPRDHPICHGCKPTERRSPDLLRDELPTSRITIANGRHFGACVGAICAVCLGHYPLSEVALYTESEHDAFLRSNWKRIASDQITAACQPPTHLDDVREPRQEDEIRRLRQPG